MSTIVTGMHSSLGRRLFARTPIVELFRCMRRIHDGVFYQTQTHLQHLEISICHFQRIMQQANEPVKTISRREFSKQSIHSMRKLNGSKRCKKVKAQIGMNRFSTMTSNQLLKLRYLFTIYNFSLHQNRIRAVYYHFTVHNSQ